MKHYQNHMETVVEEIYDEIKDSLNCCTCDQCRDDVIAYALNRLPPQYVVTRSGEVYAKVKILEQQYRTDVVSALSQAARLIAEKPRHEG